MIKATIAGDHGRTMLMIGLSKINCERLLEGKPITFKSEEASIPNIDVVIMGGETEIHIMGEMQKAGLKLPPDLVVDPKIGKV